MKLTLVALLAAAFAASATPAAACGFFRCLDEAVSDDTYPPGEIVLSPSVRALVAARQDKGMSLAGFYNDPSLAVAPADYAAAPPSPAYDAPPADPAYVETAPVYGHGYIPRRRHGPHVIVSSHGRRGDGRHMARGHAPGPGHFIY